MYSCKCEMAAEQHPKIKWAPLLGRLNLAGIDLNQPYVATKDMNHNRKSSPSGLNKPDVKKVLAANSVPFGDGEQDGNLRS